MVGKPKKPTWRRRSGRETNELADQYIAALEPRSAKLDPEKLIDETDALESRLTKLALQFEIENEMEQLVETFDAFHFRWLAHLQPASMLEPYAKLYAKIQETRRTLKILLYRRAVLAEHHARHTAQRMQPAAAQKKTQERARHLEIMKDLLARTKTKAERQDKQLLPKLDAALKSIGYKPPSGRTCFSEHTCRRLRTEAFAKWPLLKELA